MELVLTGNRLSAQEAEQAGEFWGLFFSEDAVVIHHDQTSDPCEGLGLKCLHYYYPKGVVKAN